ncbi:phage tail protein [uncultured Campylobacter sp.]|uniref:phage tail protein n=1 Tax=uncultured Campylobacter sp. TaxID=218934 RepID=UPI0026335B9A|nr:phage tail protein [uncultured Campylobacter sp.]
MANIKEDKIWEEGIYQLEVTDPVVGGVDGISNKQAKQLANRTSYLKKQVEDNKSGADLALATKRDVSDSYSKTEVDEKFTDTGKLIKEKLDKTEAAADSAKLGGLAAEKYALKSEASDGLKIGSYLFWSSDRTTPAGFLPCDGRRLAKSEYIELFDVIGYTYGGNGEHFNLPKFNDGKFIRGTGGNAASLGIAQDDAIRNIQGWLAVMSNDVRQADGAFKMSEIMGYGFNDGTSDPVYKVSFDASNVVPVASENRPYNMSVIILIKVKNVFEATNVDKSPYATEVKAGIVKLKNSITGNLADTAVSEKAAKEYMDKNASIGIGQTWQDVTTQRQYGVVYTNTTDRPIMVYVKTSSGNGQIVTLFVNGIEAANGGYAHGSGDDGINCIVPPNATYKLAGNGTGFGKWAELR